jgi:hypothetical protein
MLFSRTAQSQGHGAVCCVSDKYGAMTSAAELSWVVTDQNLIHPLIL